MPLEVDAAVVGAGAAGAVAALGLSAQGWSVAVVEPHQPVHRTGKLGIDLRHLALSPASRALLEQLGCWCDGAAFSEMVVWEALGTGHITFSAKELNLSELGWVVEASALASNAWTVLERSDVHLLSGCAVAAVERAPESVTLDLGDESIRCKLVVAADGGRSKIREALGGDVHRYPTGQHALATVVRTEQPHQGIAYQRFLANGPLALLPSTDPTLSSVVWSQAPAEADRLQALDDAAFCNALTREFAGPLGEVVACDVRLTFPIEQHVVARFAEPRVVFVGDAARTVHPLAGFGANLGLEDVRAMLAATEAPGDLGAEERFGGFVRRRGARSAAMLRLMAALSGVYRANDPASSLLRNTGVRWLNGAGWVKRQIVREALGLGPLARLR